VKIYTRTGDDGSTGLFPGGRVAKTHPRIEACGTVDELNSHLGGAAASDPADPVGESLRRVQNELFSLGAALGSRDAAPAGLPDPVWLEQQIDCMTEELAPLTNFILPGGTRAAAQIHVARSVCRRAERRVIALADQEPVSPLAMTYLNRLSDFLFVLARYENHLRGAGEPEWRKP
jgi:cob(I)alamin adenosyltransferase